MAASNVSYAVCCRISLLKYITDLIGHAGERKKSWIHQCIKSVGDDAYELLSLLFGLCGKTVASLKEAAVLMGISYTNAKEIRGHAYEELRKMESLWEIYLET